MSVCDVSVYEIVSHTAGTHQAHAGSLLPVNLCSCLGVALSLPHAEGLLLLTDLLQPLLLQEQHQRVPHVHHLDQPLEDLLLFCTLLWGLLWQTHTVTTLLARLSAHTFTTQQLLKRLEMQSGHQHYTPLISMNFLSSSSIVLCLSSSSSWRDLRQKTNPSGCYVTNRCSCR